VQISVVTAVYNGQKYIEEATASILNQTFQHFEYIVVNDGSSDKTNDILVHIKDPRVKVIHLKKNSGAAYALNKGINEARGKWIALQDADDVSSTFRLQRQLQYTKSDSCLVAVGTLIKCITGKDRIKQSYLKFEESFFNNKNNLRNHQFFSTPICNGSGFFLKKAYEKTGGYDPAFKIAYDYDLWTRMFEVGEISRVPEVLYNYRIHKNSLSHSSKLKTTKEVLISTFKNISLLRFNYLKRKPKLLLLCNNNHYNFYQKHLKHNNTYLNLSFLEQSSENVYKAYSLYSSKKVDGIIVALTQATGNILRFLGRKGLLFRENLFMVWIPENDVIN